MKVFGFIAAGLLCFGVNQLIAQEEEEFHYEFTVSGSGAFTNGETGQGIHQTASDTGGVLATYRYLFNQFNGLEVDYGHAQFTQEYDFLKDVTGIHSDFDEFTASYVVRYPYKRIAPYVTAGTGAVLFSPSQFAPAARQADATFVYGAGVDVRITRHIAFRAGYRGLVYDAPNFGLPALNTKSVTHLAEPIGGFSFRL
jgi:outer membrane immunogenic protein